jgi:HlyD family secretion protein
VPARYAALSFPVGGTLDALLVKEGDTVAAGQALARLDSATKKVDLARAAAQLTAAEARLQDLTDGPRPEDRAAAEAQLRQAQAQLKQTIASVTPADIAAAQAQIQAAQATLARLRPGANSAEVRAERLIQAQTAYSAAKWHWDHVQAHGTDPINPTSPDPKNPAKTKANRLNETQKQQYHDAFTQAESALRTAEAAVAQARVAAANAHQGEISGTQAAEQQVAAAQATLEQVTSGVLKEQLAAAQAQLAQAQAQLERLRGEQRDNQIAVAQAGVDAAQANLLRLTAAPQPSERTALEAQVASARAERDAAQLALDQLELTAPFAGQVAALDGRAGERIDANAPIVQLADTAAWQIETTDLTELSVARVQPGDRVSLTFDALPGVTLPGSVMRVKGLGENHQGDIVYRVIVVPEKFDSRLRWNMTASAAISQADAAAGKVTR